MQQEAVETIITGKKPKRPNGHLQITVIQMEPERFYRGVFVVEIPSQGIRRAFSYTYTWISDEQIALQIKKGGEVFIEIKPRLDEIYSVLHNLEAHTKAILGMVWLSITSYVCELMDDHEGYRAHQRVARRVASRFGRHDFRQAFIPLEIPEGDQFVNICLACS